LRHDRGLWHDWNAEFFYDIPLSLDYKMIFSVAGKIFLSRICPMNPCVSNLKKMILDVKRLIGFYAFFRRG